MNKDPDNHETEKQTSAFPWLTVTIIVMIAFAGYYLSMSTAESIEYWDGTLVMKDIEGDIDDAEVALEEESKYWLHCQMMNFSNFFRKWLSFLNLEQHDTAGC